MSALRRNTDKLLKQGIKALKSGDKARARVLLEQLVRLAEQNERGWYWLALAVDTEDEAQGCLERVLAINPKNDNARELLARLRVKQLEERIKQLGEEKVRRQKLVEQKAHEVSDLHAEYRQLQTQIAVLQTRRGEEEQHFNQLRSDREHLKTRVIEHQDSLTNLRHEVRSLQEQVNQLRDEQAQFEAVKTEHKRLTDEFDTLRLKITGKEQQLDSLQIKHEQLEAQVVEREQRADELQNLLQPLETEVQERQETVAGLRRKAKSLQDKIRRRETRLAELEADKTEYEKLTARLDTLHLEITDEEQQLSRFQEQREQLEAQVVEWQHQANDLQNRLQPLEAEAQKHQEVITDLRQEADSLRDETRRREARLAELEVAKESAEAEQVELTTRLNDLRLEATREEQRLDKLQAERGQREEALSDLEDRVERATDDLARLQAQRHRPLWQAILRADLDAGERTPHAELILDRLGKADPDEATAFRLEIAARTGCVDLPAHSGEELSGLPRLFAGVIQARAVESKGNLTEAVHMLCNGWEALLPVEPTPEPLSPLSVRPLSPVPPPITPAHAPSAPSDLVISTPPELVPIAPPTDPVQTAPSTSTKQTLVLEPIVKPPHSPVYVTGQWSTLTLEVNDFQILVDPGLDYSIPDNPPHLVVITHAHNDHVNQLLPLCEHFPDLPVVMTAQTCEILGLILDGWMVIRERQVHCLQMQEPRRIEGIDILLHPAGHLLGAAMADLKVDGARILVTGDFSLRSVGGLPPVELPQSLYDLVLMESVHASDHDFPSSDSRCNRDAHLIQRVLRAIEEGYTRILITATARGDAQEVYDALLAGQREPQSSALAGYTICLKGMAHGVARLYAQAGVWKHAVPDECPDPPAQQTIVVASEGAAASVRQQFSPIQRAVVFEPHKSAASSLSSERERHYCVDLHASLEELVYLGQHIQCGIIGLYHGHTSGSPLEKQLRSAGKQVVNVTTADRMRIGLDGG